LLILPEVSNESSALEAVAILCRRTVFIRKARDVRVGKPLAFQDLKGNVQERGAPLQPRALIELHLRMQ
jgi:hypothetical protein